MPLEEQPVNPLENYGDRFRQSATDLAALQGYEREQAGRAGRLYADRVGGRESLALEQQRMASVQAQRQMAGAAAAGGSPLGQRQAMIGGTRMATQMAGDLGAQRQQEIMAGRAGLADVYAQQSQRLLALQDMENRRRQAAMQQRLALEQADVEQLRGEYARNLAIIGGATQMAGGMMSMGRSMGGGGGGSSMAGGEAMGSSAYSRVGGGGYQGSYQPSNYNISDYMNTSGMNDYNVYGGGS